MDLKYTYLLIDLLCIAVPLVASFHRLSPFYKDWKFYLPANIAVAAFFLAWDALFTDMGIWGFNEAYITGIKLYNLPIEEILFFVCIPYACTYTYYVISAHIKIKPTAIPLYVSRILILLLTAIAIINISKLYTSVTFLLLSMLLVFMTVGRMKIPKNFYPTYLLMLLPFFISNGLLTGSWLDEPVVWYNDNHNLGLRLGTIPVEDAFYAMLMLLMNISAYEWLKSRAMLFDLRKFKTAE
ncbi:MAG TPA: lycopene cyclase domain-containing protein [Flavipsychrobacter sp.]